MIRFKEIVYKNIMSIGNSPITMDLTNFNKTLITGTNGAGKSTFVEAMTFALYGKPFRPITIPQLVNATNKKKLEVVITFQDKKHEYKVIRGIKPKIFEIYRDGDLIPQEASSNAYQDKLEKDILKMSLSTFKQIAVLGTAGYSPFMLLTAGKRREIIEDLLDIGVFSKMSEINKRELKVLNESISDTKIELDKMMGEVALHEQFQQENIASRTDDLQEFNLRLKTTVDKINILQEELKDLDSQNVDISSELESYNDMFKTATNVQVGKNTDELTTLKASNQEKLQRLQASSVELLKKTIAVNEQFNSEKQQMFDDSYGIMQAEFKDEYDAFVEKHNKKLKVYDEVDAAQSKTALVEKNTQSLVDFDADVKSNTPEPVDEQITEIMAKLRTNTNDRELIDKNKSFYDHNISCPTCKQDIPERFSQEFRDLADEQIKTLSDEHAEIIATAKNLRTQRTDRQTFIDEHVKKREELVAENNSKYHALLESNTNKRNEIVEIHRRELDIINSGNQNKLSEFKDTFTTESTASKNAQTVIVDEMKDTSRNSIIAMNTEQVTMVSDLVESHKAKLESIDLETKDIRNNLSEKLTVIKNQSYNKNVDLTSLVSVRNETERDIERIIEKSKLEDRTDKIAEYNSIISKLDETHSYKRKQLHCRTVVGNLLKDNGVKSLIIKQYIPMINKFINDYLIIMDANFNFVLDEEFNETIKSRGRDDFSYTSFSQGERSRIDLSLLFSFRDLVTARTGSMTNLLILDEVFDSAADAEGVESINSILSKIKDNVFIISHNEKHEQSVFDRYIRFQRKGQFTKQLN